MDKIPVPSYLVSKILEETDSDKIELHLKNGFIIKASKKLFQDYEKYKQSVAHHNSR